MPGSSVGARSTITAAPASPTVRDASCRLRMLRTFLAAFVPRCEMYSPLTTIPHLMSPRRMKSFKMKTPDIIPAHALERSKLTA